MSELITVARPYAKAVFDFAFEQQEVDIWQQMLVFTAELSSDNRVSDLLSSNIKPTKLADIFISLCGEKLNQKGQNLIRIMAINKRLAALSDVLTLFIHFRAERELSADVDVISANKLNEDQLATIKIAMEKRLSRNVKLNCKIDNSIIAGAIIRTKNTVIDGSVRGRLERLADALQS